MATASELLAKMDGNGVDEKILIIDNDLRTIIIPKSITNLGTEADKDVHRLCFQMPRYLGDVDLSELNIRINYMNANNKGDIYVVTDKTVLTSAITFSWLVGAHALAYKGAVNFIVCLKKSDADGNVLKEFNTTVANLPVLEGLEVDAAPLEGELHDILEQLLSLTEAKVAEVTAAGTEQIAKVQAKSLEEQENIAEKGAEVLATIPEDYQTTAKLANEGVRSKADAIVCSVEGETIAVSDSSDDHIRGLNLFGKSTQVTTTGKNLLDIDESVTFEYVLTLPVSIPAGTYILSYSSESHTGDYPPYVRFEDNATGALLSSSTKQYTITLTQEETIVHIYSNNYNAPESRDVEATINQLMLSVDGGDYEPYTGGIPAPNPDYPQEIVSIENPTLNVCGKNLLDIPEKLVFTQYMSVDMYLPAGEYVISCESFEGEYTYGPSVKFPKNNTWMHFKDGSLSKIITLTSHEDIIHLYSDGATYNGSAGKTATINGLMLSAVGGDYEPYTDPQSITVVRALPGIPVTSGGNYTDSDGQQWICDEIDLERGVFVQRLISVQYTGAETWRANAYYANTVQIPNSKVMSGSPVLCTTYRNTTLNENHNVVIGNAINFRDDTYATDLTVWTEHLAELAANGSPLNFLCVRSTPIETPLTAEEITAFKSLCTNYPNTTILNDAGAWMSVKYNADTKSYIESPKVLKLTDSSTGVVYELKIVDGVLTVAPV